ncbi:g10463 [Coccomyxa elongata]
MVLKTATCRFSGLRIYPGRGILYVRVDGQQYLFLNQKCKSLFAQRKRPAKIAWTVTYRKQHKKDQETQIARKKRRTTTRTQTRSIAGASMEVIAKKRAEKPEVRKASREAALREVKERLKKQKQDKAALKAAEAKRGGGKAAKTVQGARAPAASKGTRR